MSDDLNTEIKIGADASGVEAGVGRAKRSLSDLGAAAKKAGKDAGDGVGSIGTGGDKAARDVERATKSMQGSLQRLLAEQKAGAKGSREYYEALADTRGISRSAIKPILDQIDAAKSKTLQAKTAADSWTASLGKVGPLVAAAFSGAAITGFLGKVVSVQREFDVLNSSLKTVTGSSAAAEREMAWLKDFAKETPFGLAQATQGFVKMKALGLDPTRAALTSFGNTASAMGKDLNQMIEAVADASTGEFERLKEFGIKAKKEGDQVSLTFQGVTTTIKNSAEEITKYLENIGNTSFGGAMEERAKTLDGTIAALGDTWDELFRTVSTNNVGSLIFDSVSLANGALEDATTILRAMGGAAQGASRDTGALSTIQNGIATVFETVAVLGANLSYVLQGVGREIGGLAAQVVQAAQFNFAGVSAIREQMVADAEAARREIDATTARILNARKEQEEYARWATRNASAATDPRRVDLGGGTTRAAGGASSGAAKAVKETISEYDKLIKKLSDELPAASAAAEAAQMGYNKAQTEFLALAASPAWAKFTNDQRATVAALFENKIAIEQSADAAKTLAKANLDAAASREKYLTSLSTGLDKIQADIAAQIEATERMGLSKEAIAELDAAKLEMLATDLELQAIKAMDRNLDRQTYDALKKQAAAYRELGIAKKGGAAKEAALEMEKANAESAKKAQEDWERASEQINSTLTDALMRGFEDGKGFASNFRDTLKNMFRTLVLRPIISFVVQPIGNLIQGAIGGLLGGGQGGAGGLFSTASNANSLFSGASLISNWMGTGAGAGMGTLAYGNMIGAMGGDGLGAFMAANGGWGTSGAGALANSAGSAFGGAAAGIAAVAAPLIIGSLIERNARDRISGAAYATSGGNDPFVNTVAGSTSFDYLTGDLPDRAALLARLEELGAPMEAISDWNDRALLRLTESAAADNSEFGINWTSRVRDMRDTPDFYRGAGYAHPEELGWWNNKDNANLSTDPALIQASRDIALSIIGPLEGIGALIGDEAAYRATVGFANRGEGNGLWAGMNLQRDGQNVADWVNTDDFHSVGEAVRAMYSTALGTLDSFDLPGWADKQVTDARTALDALSGDKIGEQAAALYQQATGGISATFAAIEKMINLFPDFAEASQDAVYALGELTGGLDNLASAYGSYLSNFYSEEERRQLMFKELDSELDKLGIDTIPRTRAEFRELVSAQDLSTEAGREAFTVLMKLSGGFAEFVDAAESAADKASERIDSIFGQISKLWDEQISNWSKLSSEAKSVFDVAIKAAKDLRGQVADTRQWDASAASVWIDQALAGLRATGALPDSKELADAIEAARGGLDMSQYDTVAEMERDQLILAGKLNEIGDSAEVQMSFAEQQVQLLEQQRDYWRQQIDLLNATGETITSIDQGIEYLADYVREQTAIKAAEEAEKEASREAARRAALSISPGGWGGGGWGGGGGQDLTSITRTINWDTGEYVYPDGSGGTLSPEELEYFRKILDGERDPTRIISDLYQVPRHADGGRYAGGLALVGERGPELINFASPGHIYTADQTRDMMRGGDNAELIAELRELRARLDKIERNTAVLPQTHDVIDRVTAGGNAMLTEAA